MGAGKVRARGKVWAEGAARAGRVDDRAHRSDRQPQGRAGPLRRRAVGGRRRVGDLLRQHQGLQEQVRLDSEPQSERCGPTYQAEADHEHLTRTSCRPRRRPRASLRPAVTRRSSDPGSGDWPMWGGTPDRNMVSSMKGLPTTWDLKTKKNVKWVAELGSQAYGNPVVAGGIVLVGTNNEAMRDPNIKGDKGILMAFRESGRPVPVAGGARQARGRPRQRLAVPGHLLVAAHRGRHRVLHVQPRRADGGRPRRLPRRLERRPREGREERARDRRRRHLALRHDGRARRDAAQHGERLAGQPRRF